MVVRSHNELPAQQVVPEHACKIHHGQHLLPGGAVSLLIGGQTETSIGNRLLLSVLNLGKLVPYGLGRGVCVQNELAIRCREGQDWRRRQGLLKSIKSRLLFLPPDERFLLGQAIEGKCQLSITSYKASMVVGKTQKPIDIFCRVGSRLVPEGLHIGISHFHSLGADLAFQELHSPLEQRALLWLKLDKHTS